MFYFNITAMWIFHVTLSLQFALQDSTAAIYIKHEDKPKGLLLYLLFCFKLFPFLKKSKINVENCCKWGEKTLF